MVDVGLKAVIIIIIGRIILTNKLRTQNYATS